MDKLTITNIRYFLEAAKYQNFSKAADALYVHPTTICRGINAMEEELGGPLFHRFKYSLQLTELGMHFLREAGELVERYDRLLHEAQIMTESLQGSITMLSPQRYFQTLAEGYRDFVDKYPRVEFAVDICPMSRMDTIGHAIADGVADIGIMFSSSLHDDSGTLESMVLFREDLVLAVPEGRKFTDEDSCRLSELRDVNLFMCDFQNQSVFRDITEKLDPRYNTIQVLPTSAGETLLLKFSAGMGAMIMPKLLAAQGKGEFQMLKVLDADLYADVLMVWRKDHTNPALHAFLDCVRRSLEG